MQDAKAGHAEDNGLSEGRETKKRTKKMSREEHAPESGAVSRLADKVSPDKIMDFARDLPQLIEKEMKENPVRTVGIAAGVGFGVGAVVGSRLLRMALLATGGYLASEVARGRMKKVLDELAAQIEAEGDLATK